MTERLPCVVSLAQSHEGGVALTKGRAPVLSRAAGRPREREFLVWAEECRSRVAQTAKAGLGFKALADPSYHEVLNRRSFPAQALLGREVDRMIWIIKPEFHTPRE